MITSTSEVYGKGTKVPFSEDDDVVLGPTKYARWAYGASKMVDEFLGLAYFEKYKHPVKIFRLFNTVGPGQSGQYGMVVPRFVQQALKNKPITVYGSGDQARSFCDVTDVCEAIWLLYKNDSCIGQIFNIGGQEEISMSDLATKIKKLTKSKSKIIKVPYSEAYGPGFEDMNRRFPSIDKIKEHTGWVPKINLDNILKRTIDFEKKRLSK
jgi:UDP-glucose 4-epimerase